MDNNDILRRLRYALNLSDAEASAMFSLHPVSGRSVSEREFRSRIAKQEEDHYLPCDDTELSAFLDGLIVHKRGYREPSTPTRAPHDERRLTRNDILKKLRIALNFREEQMLATLKVGGSDLSRSELSALFRKPGHKHYRVCGNQVLRNFISGLTKPR